MNHGTLVILKKEWMGFIGGERSAFLVYGILIVAWSLVFLTSGSESMNIGPLWVAFFSVLVSANFCNSVFIAERISGALEILITSGLSRDAVLYGKMVFTIVMTTVIGACCAMIAIGGSLLIPETVASVHQVISLSSVLLYLTATFVNAASSAYFSVRLSSPRLLYFVNLFLMGLIMTLYTVLNTYFAVPLILFAVLLTGLGVLFTWSARREFRSERIVQPVSM